MVANINYKNESYTKIIKKFLDDTIDICKIKNISQFKVICSYEKVMLELFVDIKWISNTLKISNHQIASFYYKCK